MATHFYHQGHTYQLVLSAKSWLAASQYAQALDAHLAKISSAAENAAIFRQASSSVPLASAPSAADGGGASYLWLGASDKAVEGTWRWYDGTLVSNYRNWGSGLHTTEPDDYQRRQDGMAMGLESWPQPSGGIGVPGEWNDLNLNDALYSVIEWDFLRGTTSRDQLVGTASKDRIDGLAGDDRLSGGLGNDSLSGGAGNDLLLGGLGNDSLSGGSGRDSFRFDTRPNASSNRDRIADFNVRDDTLQLENAVFTSLTGVGALAQGSLRAGSGVTSARDANDHLIYNRTTGALYYDADGNGSGAVAVQFATLPSGLALSNLDFLVT